MRGSVGCQPSGLFWIPQNTLNTGKRADDKKTALSCIIVIILLLITVHKQQGNVVNSSQQLVTVCDHFALKRIKFIPIDIVLK